MSTIKAIRNLGDELAEGIEREGNVLKFSLPDHEAEVKHLADAHRRSIASRSQRIADTKDDLRKTLAALNAEVARLKVQLAEAQEGAARKIAADERIIVAGEAFLSAVGADIFGPSPSKEEAA